MQKAENPTIITSSFRKPLALESKFKVTPFGQEEHVFFATEAHYDMVCDDNRVKITKCCLSIKGCILKD